MEEVSDTSEYHRQIMLIRGSAYVKDPLKNLAAWNKGLRPSEPPRS